MDQDDECMIWIWMIVNDDWRVTELKYTRQQTNKKFLKSFNDKIWYTQFLATSPEFETSHKIINGKIFQENFNQFSKLPEAGACKTDSWSLVWLSTCASVWHEVDLWLGEVFFATPGSGMQMAGMPSTRPPVFPSMMWSSRTKMQPLMCSVSGVTI